MWPPEPRARDVIDVFDPFGGSLTTMAVAMEMGRRAISTEMHLEYAQGGVARLIRFSRRKD